MDILASVERFVDAPTVSAARREARGGGPAFARAVLDQVRQDLGKDPQRAVRTTRRWKLLLDADAATAHWLKAIGEHVSGSYLKAADSYRTAGRLCRDAAQTCKAETGAIDALARAGSHEAALKLGRRLVRRLTALGEPELAGRAYVNIGNALTWIDDHPSACAAYESATTLLADSRFQSEYAMALLGLSTTALYDRPALDCLDLAGQAMDAFEKRDKPFLVKLARINRAHAFGRLGRFDDALREFSSLRDEALPTPHRERVAEFLADTYLALGLFREAELAYRQLLAAPGLHPIARANVTLGLGQAQLGLDDRGTAARSFHRARKLYLQAGNRPWAARAESLRARARNAIVAGDEISEMKRSGLILFWVEAILENALRSNDRRALRSMLTTIRKYGFLSIEWKAHAYLGAIDEGQGKRSHFRRMVDAILAHRLLLDSSIARSSFFHDKEAFLSEYIELLLSRPTGRRRQEALEVVSKTRSATLVDEMLSRPPEGLTAQEIEVLERLRSQLRASEDTQHGTRRPSSTRVQIDARLVIDQFVQRRLADGSLEATPDSLSLCLGTRQSSWLGTDRHIPLHLTRQELAADLRWLEFERRAFIMGRGDAVRTGRKLAEMREKLRLDEVSAPVLCLSGAALGLPIAMVCTETERVCALHPSTRSVIHNLPTSPRVAILYHESRALPLVMEEVSFLKERYPDARVATTIAEVQKLAGDGPFDIIHVAAHGMHHPQNPLCSYLEMADGPLMAYDVMRLGLSADVVNLAACESGVLSSVPPLEPTGFVSAFLAGGATYVLGSLWPIADKAAWEMSKEFYESLGRGAEVRVAVRDGRQAVARSHQNPFEAGAYVLYAGGRN